MNKCRKAAYLLSKKQDETRLTVPERVFLGSHLLICPHCREYKKQLDLFHKRKHGLIAVEDEFSMKWKAHKKAGFLNSAFEIWRDMGGFEDAADSVQTAQ